MPRVMLIELPLNEVKRFKVFFRTVSVDCEYVEKFETALEKVPADPPTLIIARKPERTDALLALKSVLAASAPSTPFLVTLPNKKADVALEMMNAGAFDCLAKPFTRFSVLAASKRATLANGRTLFGSKVKPDKIPWAVMLFALFASFALTKNTLSRWEGAPPATLNLASATLSGVQWEGRELWVGNWYDSTVTHYHAKNALLEKNRVLLSDEIFRMQDSQPILVCDTPEALITLGFDLKLRSHQRSVGLPTLQTAGSPANNPTGLAWDGANLWSSDGQTGLLYKHGADLRVLDSVKSILPSPSGIAWDGTGLWVMGGQPLRVAKLEKSGSSFVWRGPYKLNNFLPPDVPPTGMAVGFEKLWVVTGGAPHMTSRPLKEIVSQLDGWK